MVAVVHTQSVAVVDIEQGWCSRVQVPAVRTLLVVVLGSLDAVWHKVEGKQKVYTLMHTTVDLESMEVEDQLLMGIKAEGSEIFIK